MCRTYITLGRAMTPACCGVILGGTPLRPTRQENWSMTLRIYEITFRGEAVPAIVAAFDDFEVTVTRGTTTLRGEGMDQSALYGALDRLQELRLELLQVTSAEQDGSGD
jgi:hypothetical protein